MKTVLILAQKEIRDAFRNKLFLVLLVLLFLLTVVSLILGSFQVRISLDAYNHSIAVLRSLGKKDLPQMPSLNPISASKGFVNYLGMVGALTAIVLGNQAISKENKSGTLRLILTRGVFRDLFLNGKLLGNLALLALITAATAVITAVTLPLVGGVVPALDEWVRLGLFFLISFVYLAFFLILSMGAALLFSSGNKALLVTVIFWLLLAFVLPQIGDTMDMDNQLPGGFFAQMGMTRDQEKQLVSQFKFYETLRNGIEELSPTKHFERASFALLNVKPGFEQNTAWQVLGLKWFDLAGLLLPSVSIWLLAYLTFQRREGFG